MKFQPSSHKESSYICPFFKSTKHQFVFQLLLRFCLDNYELYSLPFEGGKDWKTSKQEMEFLSFIRFLYPSQQIQSLYSCRSGPPKLIGAESDGSFFSPDLGYVHCFFNGSGPFHGSPKIKKEALPTNLATFDLKSSWKKVSKDWDLSMDNLLKKNPGKLHTIFCIWDAQWEELKKHTPLLRTICTTPGLSYVSPLVPREALVPGKSELWVPLWNQSDNPSQVFHNLDMNSQFASIMERFTFSAGPFFRLCENQLSNQEIKFDATKKSFIYKDKLICSGFVKALFLPDQNQILPTLFCKIEGRLTSTLCRTCFVQKQTSPCYHLAADRAFVATVTWRDVETAVLSKTYSVLRIYETWLFTQQVNLGKNFFCAINTAISATKGFPTNLPENKRAEYCEEINGLLGLSGQLKLQEHEIKNDISYKTFLKLISTSSLGCLASRHKTGSQICTTQNELSKVFATKNVVHFQTLGLNKVKVNYERKQPRCSRSNYAIILAEVYSLSRRLLQDAGKEILNSGFKIVNMNVDSIAFLAPKTCKEIPLQCHVTPGTWKKVHNDQVTSYYALSPNNSLTTFKCSPSKLKICGLKADLFQQDIKEEDYKNLIRNALKKRKNSIKLNRTVTRKKINQAYTLRNKLCDRRYYVQNGSSYQSYPYGYTNLR